MTPDPPAHSATPPAAPPSPFDPGQYERLDPRALRLWQLTDAISYAVLLVIALGIGIAVMVSVRGSAPWVLVCWAAVVALALWTVLIYHPRNYRAWGYRLDERVLLVRKGVWFRTVKLLPLPRLQHVDVKSGPLQRRYGLATLVLHTAGTHAASIEVPGLEADEAVRLRDRLVAAGGDDGV